MYTDKIKRTIEELNVRKQNADGHTVAAIEAEITDLYRKLINFGNMR
jgi:hypothetical protein